MPPINVAYPPPDLPVSLQGNWWLDKVKRTWYILGMAAPRRIPNAVYILVPSEGRNVNDVVHHSRVAGRVAVAQGLVPFSPLLFYMAYMTEEELVKKLPAASLSIIKRVSRIWLCDLDSPKPCDVTDIDALSHRLLRDNEGLLAPRRKRYSFTSRVPVHYFTQDKDGTPRVRVLDRLEIAEILQCNIVTGLFSGVAHAMQG